MMNEKDLKKSEEATVPEPDTQESMESLKTDDTAEEAPITPEKPFRPFKFFLELIFCAMIIFAIVQLVKWPSAVAGLDLWDEEIESHTRQSVYDELIGNGLPSEISLRAQTANVDDLDYTVNVLKWKEFKQRTQSQFLFSYLVNDMKEGKKVYCYTYVENWDVYLDDKKITTVETTTIAIAQPKIWGDYPFYRYVTDTVYASNFEQLMAEYQQQANQADLTSRVTIDDSWLEDSSSIWGDDTLFVVNYTWTNQSSDYAAPIYNIAVSAYQDNIELSRSYIYDTQYSTTNSIAPGESTTYTQAYYLGNEFSPVTVRATDYWATLQDYPAEVSKIFSLE